MTFHRFILSLLDVYILDDEPNVTQSHTFSHSSHEDRLFCAFTPFQPFFEVDLTYFCQNQKLIQALNCALDQKLQKDENIPFIWLD